jgi:hypothetical protein
MLFTVAIFSTFIGDYLHSFFGDVLCNSINCRDMINPDKYDISHYHWGYRHYLYFVMCVILFLIQCSDVIRYAKSES